MMRYFFCIIEKLNKIDTRNNLVKKDKKIRNDWGDHCVEQRIC